MKIKQLIPQPTTFQSFGIRRDVAPQHHNIWHYHEEIEFILVKKGTGQLFVGDCIKEFVTGDIFLIGANIPHYWLFDNAYLGNDENTIDCIVVHFRSDCLGSDFIHLPEAVSFKELVTASQRALHARISDSHRLSMLFEHTLRSEGIIKIAALLETLWTFTQESPETLVSDAYVILNHSDDVRRMNVVMEFIRRNFASKIALEELAQLAQMTRNSFSRYFRQKTGKTPMQLIFELRIANACKLLRNPTYSLKEICYDSGFNNAVSFHKIFKAAMRMTPIQYRRHFLSNNT